MDPTKRSRISLERWSDLRWQGRDDSLSDGLGGAAVGLVDRHNGGEKSHPVTGSDLMERRPDPARRVLGPMVGGGNEANPVLARLEGEAVVG